MKSDGWINVRGLESAPAQTIGALIDVVDFAGATRQSVHPSTVNWADVDRYRIAHENDVLVKPFDDTDWLPFEDTDAWRDAVAHLGKGGVVHHKFKDGTVKKVTADSQSALNVSEITHVWYEPLTSAKGTCIDPNSRYYDAGGIETIDIIKAKLTPEQLKGYLLGNVIKYSSRLNFKGSAVRDAEKLKFYSTWLEQLK